MKHGASLRYSDTKATASTDDPSQVKQLLQSRHLRVSFAAHLDTLHEVWLNGFPRLDTIDLHLTATSSLSGCKEELTSVWSILLLDDSSAVAHARFIESIGPEGTDT